ncbi:MAG: helix-turn-helix domain-containing protein [Alphaproteobacteria bacterium]
MKPLYHPSATDITVEGVLYALSDPVRVRIYADIAKSECPKICSAFLGMGEGSIPKSTLSQHFKILREAGLIRSERKGVELHNVTRCNELKERFGPLVANIIEAYGQQQKKNKSRKRVD